MHGPIQQHNTPQSNDFLLEPVYTSKHKRTPATPPRYPTRATVPLSRQVRTYQLSGPRNIHNSYSIDQGMATGDVAPPALRAVNSETNLAVQLLAALRGGNAAPPAQLYPPRRQRVLPRVAPARPRSEDSTDGGVGEDEDFSSPCEGEDEGESKGDAEDDTGDAVSKPLGAVAEAGDGKVEGVLGSDGNTLYKYSPRERQEALRRFKEKKRRRTFKKTVRYRIRQELAGSRPRYKGRFTKPPAGENYDDGTPGPPLPAV